VSRFRAQLTSFPLIHVFGTVPLRGPDQAGVGIQNPCRLADPGEIPEHARIAQDTGPLDGFDQAEGGLGEGFGHLGIIEQNGN
jgi:hypothetical protein